MLWANLPNDRNFAHDKDYAIPFPSTNKKASSQNAAEGSREEKTPPLARVSRRFPRKLAQRCRLLYFIVWRVRHGETVKGPQKDSGLLK